MLLSVGENDFRVPLNNTLENWSALQRMKVPSRLLVWPDENHWILNGENSRHFYEEVHAWLARWLTATPQDGPERRTTLRPDGGRSLRLSPLDPRVGDSEAVALGVPLRRAAGLGAHHREVAAMVGGMSQPRCQESRLHAATPCVRYGARPGQQSHALVQNQRAGGGNPPIELTEKRPAIVAGRNDPAERRA